MKEREDISKPFGVQFDGSGLSATLYHMQRGAQSSANNDIPFSYNTEMRRRNRLSDDANLSFSRVVDQLRLVNGSIRDLTVDSEPF